MKTPFIFQVYGIRSLFGSCTSINYFKYMRTKINVVQNQLPHPMIKSYILRIIAISEKINEDLRYGHLL